LGLDVANSFLIIASPKAKKIISTGVLAYHYSVERIPAYCKETVFILSDGEDIRVEYRRLGTPNKDADKANNQLIKFILPDSFDYVFGKPLSLEFISIVTRDGWTFDQVARFISRYLSIVETFAKLAGIQISMTSPYTELPGEFFDVIPQNIIIHEDASPSLIDKEWQLANPIEIGHLLFRSLLWMVNSISRFGRPASGVNMTRYQLIDGAFSAAGLRLQEGDYTRYVSLEAEIQQSVTGCAAENYLNWGKDQPLPILNLSQAVAERNQEVQTLTETVAQRDAVVAERDGQIGKLNQTLQTLTEQCRQIASLNQTMTERDNAIQILTEQIRERSRALTARQNKLDGLNQTLAERDQTVKVFADQLRRKDAVDELGKQIAILNTEATNLSSQIDAIMSSRSWKLTAPLRLISTQLKRYF